MIIRPIRPTDAEACDAVVASLPFHFSREEDRNAVAAAVRRERGLVATSHGGVVGFVTYRFRGEQAEITWLAIANDNRRHGIGRDLLAVLHHQLAKEGMTSIAALTATPAPIDDPADGHGATRRFYASHGYALGHESTHVRLGRPALPMVRPLV